MPTSGEVCLGVGWTGGESCSVRALLPPTSNIRPAPAPGRLTQLWGSCWAGRGLAHRGLACCGPASPEPPFLGSLAGCGQNVQPARGGHWVCAPTCQHILGPTGLGLGSDQGASLASELALGVLGASVRGAWALPLRASGDLDGGVARVRVTHPPDCPVGLTAMARVCKNPHIPEQTHLPIFQ